MKKILTLAIFVFFNQMSLAKEIPLTEFDPQVDSCISSYLNNPLFKENISLNNNQTLDFFIEIQNYCNCESKELKSYFNRIKEDWIAAAFEDKKPQLLKRDVCAMQNFSRINLKAHYILKFHQWFEPQIQSKLKEVAGEGVKMISGVDKWEEYSSCFHEIISKECTKIESLAATYSCIKNSFKIDSFDKNHRECQMYLSEPKQLRFIINKDEDLFI